MNKSVWWFFLILLLWKNGNCAQKCSDIECDCLVAEFRRNICRDVLQIIECSTNLSANDSIPTFNHFADQDKNGQYYYNEYEYSRGNGITAEQNKQICRGRLLVRSSTIPILSPATFSDYPLLEFLDLEEDHIEEIKPGTFDNLANLEILNLANNQITAIKRGTFQLLHKLQNLQLENNDVTYIEPFSFLGCSELQEIYLKHNHLTQISRRTFDQLTQLVSLDISENFLNNFNLNFTNMNNLHSLNLAGNQLETFATEDGLKQLKELDLSRNQLKMFNLSHGLYNFDLLNLSKNLLETINLSQTVTVGTLDLSDNRIRTLGNWHNFTFLNLNRNLLEEMIEIAVGHLSIHMGGNRLKTLENHEQNRSTKQLKSLDLGDNSISSIAQDFFSTLSNLEELDLGGNHLKTIQLGLFTNLRNLKKLDLSSNAITYFQVGTFGSMHNLTFLNISDNQLLKIHHEFALGHLERFYLDQNFLTYINVKEFLIQFNNLTEVSINGNQWNCDDLTTIYREFTEKSVNVLKGSSYNVENVEGIACGTNNDLFRDTDDEIKDEMTLSPDLKSIDAALNSTLDKFKQSLNSAFANSDFYKYFQMDYKKSAFFKYLDSYKFVLKQDPSENSSNYIKTTGFGAFHLEPIQKETGQNYNILLSLIFLVLLLIASGIFINTYFVRMSISKNVAHKIDVEDASSSQMELCEHYT